MVKALGYWLEACEFKTPHCQSATVVSTKLLTLSLLFTLDKGFSQMSKCKVINISSTLLFLLVLLINYIPNYSTLNNLQLWSSLMHTISDHFTYILYKLHWLTVPFHSSYNKLQVVLAVWIVNWPERITHHISSIKRVEGDPSRENVIREDAFPVFKQNFTLQK